MATGLGLGFVTWIDGAKRKGIDLFSSDWAKFGGIGLESWSMFSTPLYQEASAQGCTVLLSGAGGDELVSAQARGAYFELLLRGEFGYLLRELNSEGVRKEWTAAVRIKRLLASVLGAGAPALASRLGKIPPAQFEHFLDQEVADHYCIMERKREAYARLAYGRLREWQERLLCGSYLSNRRLPQSFARSFVAGVELRYPMLDTRLIEFCFAVPPRVLRNGGLGRALLRGACRELPDYIRFRDNKSVPAIPWVGRYLAEQANALQSIVRTNQPIAPLLDLGLLKQQLDSWGRAKVAEGVLSRRSAVLGLAALLG